MAASAAAQQDDCADSSLWQTGPIFEAVQAAALFADSKTFVYALPAPSAEAMFAVAAKAELCSQCAHSLLPWQGHAPEGGPSCSAGSVCAAAAEPGGGAFTPCAVRLCRAALRRCRQVQLAVCL